MLIINSKLKTVDNIAYLHVLLLNTFRVVHTVKSDSLFTDEVFRLIRYSHKLPHYIS